MTTTEAMLPALLVSIMGHSRTRDIITFVEAFCNTAQTNDGIAGKKVKVEDFTRCTPQGLTVPSDEVVRTGHDEDAWCFALVVTITWEWLALGLSYSIVLAHKCG